MGKLFLRTLVSLAMVGLLALNVATVTVPAVAAGVAATVGAVMGAASLLPEFRTVSYRGQQKRLAEAVSDTTKRISTRTAKGAARNVGSVGAESIPIAGIAAVVGATTWEVKDACDTMKDLRALDLATNSDAVDDPDVAEVCGMQVPTKEEAWEAMKASPGQAWEAAKAYVPDLPELELPSWRDIVGGPPGDPDATKPAEDKTEDWTDRLKKLNPFD